MTIEEDLVRDEGRRLKVYDDATGKPIVPGYTLLGHPTIGVGRALDTNGLSDEEVDYLLANDKKRVEADLDREQSWWRSRPDPVQSVLAELSFQLGIDGLGEFKRFLAAVHAGDYRTAIGELQSSQLARQAPARIQRYCDTLSAQ